MAVVIVIIGLVMGTVFPALATLRSNSQRAATQSNLHSLMLATAAYVQANGCVPCPAQVTPYAVTGLGSIPGYSATTPCGTCVAATAEGIPPFLSLGLPASIAKDGWGHWITMRMDPALAAFSASPMVPPIGNKGICTSSLSTQRTPVVASPVKVFQTVAAAYQLAAVVFVSHGAKGYGAYVADASSYNGGRLNGCRMPFPNATGSSGLCPAQPTCPAGDPSGCGSVGSCYAQCNAAGKPQFVDAAMGSDYDDMLAYVDRNALVSMFGNGSCQTVW